MRHLRREKVRGCYARLAIDVYSTKGVNSGYRDRRCPEPAVGCRQTCYRPLASAVCDLYGPRGVIVLRSLDLRGSFSRMGFLWQTFPAASRLTFVDCLKQRVLAPTASRVSHSASMSALARPGQWRVPSPPSQPSFDGRTSATTAGVLLTPLRAQQLRDESDTLARLGRSRAPEWPGAPRSADPKRDRLCSGSGGPGGFVRDCTRKIAGSLDRYSQKFLG